MNDNKEKLTIITSNLKSKKIIIPSETQDIEISDPLLNQIIIEQPLQPSTQIIKYQQSDTFFTEPLENLAKEIDYNFPIGLQKINHLVEKVSNRYPYLNKLEVSQIIRQFFGSIRTLLLLGNQISLETLFWMFRLKKDIKLTGLGTHPVLALHSKTPKELKYSEKQQKEIANKKKK